MAPRLPPPCLPPRAASRSVDATWRRVMAQLAKGSGEVLAVAAEEGLLKSLEECNVLLEQVRADLGRARLSSERERLSGPRVALLVTTAGALLVARLCCS